VGRDLGFPPFSFCLRPPLARLSAFPEVNLFGQSVQMLERFRKLALANRNDLISRGFALRSSAKTFAL
jgi:hypothetical protein